MPSLSLPKPQLDLGSLKSVSMPSFKAGSKKGELLVGLDIQPGYIAAVQAHVNGSVRVERAAGMDLPGDVVREGEVVDGDALTEALRELFRSSRLDKRVRIGVANQRTVLRMLELPPIADRKELEAAVRFQAEDQVPMPLENATLDFHPLDLIETAAGPRQRVVVVAAQREMIQRLLSAARNAGLQPEGVDLSAFALIRSLHTPGEEEAEPRVLYLNVAGLTNMAIAEGTVCRFTRVIGGGLESIAGSAAAAHNMPLSESRNLLGAVDLTPRREPEPEPVTEIVDELDDAEGSQTPTAHETPSKALYAQPSGPDLRPTLESGLREIAGAVRNSLEFHRLQDGGGDVSAVVLSGPALRIAGFAQALERELGVPVRARSVELLSGDSVGSAPPECLAVAAGLAVEEAPR